MTNLFTYLSNLLSLSLGSPCTDVSLDRRSTVGSPSGRYCSGLMRLVFILAILLTVGVGNAWGATTTLAGWTFTSGTAGTNYPSNNTNFNATSGTMSTNSTFCMNGSGSTWNDAAGKGYAFTSVSSVVITLKLNQKLAAGAQITLAADVFYNKEKNKPVGSYAITTKVGSAVASSTGVGTTTWTLSTSSANKTSTYTTQAEIASGTTIQFILTASGSSGSGQAYFNNVTIKSTTYTVTYNANSGTGSVPTDATAYCSKAIVTVKGNTGPVSRDGYTFGGWNTNTSGTGTNYTAGSGTFTITANTTLYAKWESAAACSANPSIGNASINGSVNLSSVPFTCSVTSEGGAGCSISDAGFVWKDGSDPSASDNKTAGTYSTSITGTIPSAGSFSTGKTYYVKAYATNDNGTALSSTSYQFRAQSITFYGNTNTGGSMSVQYVEYNKSTALTTNGFSKTGHSFAGWATSSSGSVVYTDGQSVTATGNMELYAKWSVSSYDVTLKANGGSGDDQVVSATYGAAMPTTLKGGGAIVAPSRNGYTFAGYYDTDASTGGTQYYTNTLASAHVWDKTSAANLYGRWTANNYTVTLDANGGEDGATTSVNTTFGQAMPTIAAANLPTREGYRFDGFWTDQTSGTQYYYANGTSAKNQARYSANQTLYAHWKALTYFSVNGDIVPGLTIDDGDEMPGSGDVDVPTECGNCWAFAGWSTDPDEDGAPEYAGGAKHEFGEPTTLYAVFGQAKYRIIKQTSDMSANEYYVLTFDSIGVTPAMTYNITDTYYTTSENIAVKSDETGAYIEGPISDIVWKFTGTTSAGRFYNEAGSKYMDISDYDAAPVASSTSDYMTISVYNSSKKQFNIRSNTETSYYLQLYKVGWGVDNDHDGYYSACIFKRSEATYTTIPPCSEYTVTWAVDNDGGSAKGTTVINSCQAFPSTIPSAPADNTLSCATKFMGWSASQLIGTGQSEPDDLFSSVEYAPVIDDDITFNAVFASVDTESESPASVTSTFTSVSWEDDNSLWTSDKAAYRTDTKGVQVTKDYTGAGAHTKSSYNKVTSIVITYGTSNNATGSIAVSVGGTAMTLSSGSISEGQSDQTLTYTPTAPATSLTGVVSFVATVTNKSIYIKSIQINYKTFGYKDYMTSCCDELVTLSTSITGSGTITFSPTSPIATCDDDKNVTMTITPAAGYKLKTWAVATGVGYVDADDTDPAVVTDEDNSTPQPIALTFNQHKSGTYAVAATFEAMHDEYYDYMHDNAKVGANRTGSYSAPSRTSKTAGKTDNDCKGNHYKFKGWVVSTEINDDGTLKSGYTLITAGTSMTASNKIYYAVWAEEED